MEAYDDLEFSIFSDRLSEDPPPSFNVLSKLDFGCAHGIPSSVIHLLSAIVTIDRQSNKPSKSIISFSFSPLML